MRTTILVKGDVLPIENAHGTVRDDFGYDWVSVKGEYNRWHYRTPANMDYTQEEYDKEIARVQSKNKMSQWHIETQDMLQKMWPEGQKEFYSLDKSRITDFKAGSRVFEAQYSNMSDDEPYERTEYWSEQGYYVTWILAPHILNEYKYEPKYMWHGDQFDTANFPVKNLNKWLRPLEVPGTAIITTLPLFEWGILVDVKQDARDEQINTGNPGIYRFHKAEYNSKFKNWLISGGCTYNWLKALIGGEPFRKMNPWVGGRHII